MAIEATKRFLSVTLADFGGNTSTLRFDLDFADLAALVTGIADITGAGGLIADLAAVTNAAVVAYSLGEEYKEAVVASQYGAADSQVEDIALITAKIDGEPGKYANLRIPAPVTGIFLAGPGPEADQVDVTDVALRAYLNNFIAAGIALVSDGENIEDPTTSGAFKGKRIHRASRKG